MENLEKLIVFLCGERAFNDISLIDSGRLKIFVIFLIGIIIIAPFGSIDAYLNGSFMLSAYGLLMWLSCFVAIAFLRNNFNYKKVAIVHAVIFSGLYLLLVVFGGASSYASIVWPNLFIACSFFILGFRLGSYINIFFIITYLVLVFLQEAGYVSSIFTNKILIWGFIQLIIMFLVVYLFEHYLKKVEDEHETQLSFLENMTIKDPLTGLYNRRFFDEVFYREINRCRRMKKPFTFVIADIDHFKAYNDTYGHTKGDSALIEVAHQLALACNRSSDYAVRIGGEEFAVIFPEMSPEKAPSIIEEMREKIENLKIPHRASPTSNVVTASFGYVSMNPDENTCGDNLFEEVDKALYKAKKDGRNTVIRVEPTCALEKSGVAVDEDGIFI